MGSKINLKARIERHSRVLLEQGKLSYRKNHKSFHHGYNIVCFTLIFLVPIYPVFASFVNDTSEYEFNRSDIDETSIIVSSSFGSGDVLENQDIFVQSKDSYLSIDVPIDSDRDVSGSSEVIEYTVQKDESLTIIASRFKVSRETIRWANNFDDSHSVKKGDIIKIPPVSGVLHTVKSGQTLSEIAQKYGIDQEIIMRQNLLISASDIKGGTNLIIPGGKIKEEIKPVEQILAKSGNGKVTTKSKSGIYSFAAAAKSEYVNSGGNYKLSRRKPQHTFYWGNCTWYVAQYKNVNWGGNANAWLRNAAAKGHATGSSPSLGAIITFNGRGYNPRYGHVGIVSDITSTHVIVSDMNYRALGEVTTRKVPISDRAISGYIYVD